MASLDDLKKRITSVKSTQKITKAMKMVAAAKLRRAQENAEKGRPYSDKMHNIILNLSNGISDKENAPKLLKGSGNDKTHLCVVLTSDRGLCGGFNTNIIKKAKSYFQKILNEGKSLKIITVGSKGYDQLKRVYSDKIIEKISFKDSKNVNYLDAENWIIELYRTNPPSTIKIHSGVNNSGSNHNLFSIANPYSENFWRLSKYDDETLVSTIQFGNFVETATGYTMNIYNIFFR